jgi:uncharacterized membrane protein YdjX (TVP38/TMEM64 family)
MRKLVVDIFIISASIYLAIYLLHTGTLDALIDAAGDNILLVSFIAGLLFTSFFTTPVAIAVFADLAGQGNPLLIAMVGGLGAVLGDSFLFFFVRERVAKDASALMTGPRLKRVMRVLKKRRFRRIVPFIGALIIASPLPDEIGLTLIGVSKLSRRSFFLLSYTMNMLGILAILLSAGIF